MGRTGFAKAIGVCLLLGMVAFEAAGWGGRTQQAMASTALQVLRQKYADAFKSSKTDENYGSWVVKGMEEGPSALTNAMPTPTEQAVSSAISSEMVLLRNVRSQCSSMYLSYRFGVLARRVSDLWMPFAFSPAPEDQKVMKQIEADIDAHVSRFSFAPEGGAPMTYLRNPQAYFQAQREYLREIQTIVSADYSRGPGYQGYLLKGGEALFCKAVQSLADVWFTIIRPEGDVSDVAPSPESLAWLYVDEIRFRLEAQSDLKEAEKAYKRFADVNARIMAAHEKIGDYFLAASLKERAVVEWKLALMLQGPERARIQSKLAQYYLEVGKTLFATASAPDAPETALNDALEAFSHVLDYDRANKDAEDMLGKTQAAITDKEERRQLAVRLVASAEKVLGQAKRSDEEKSTSNAIASFKRAILLYDTVGEEFKAQSQASKTGRQTAQAGIKRVLEKVLTDAEDSIDSGTRLVEDNKFDEAIAKYKDIDKILSVISDDPDSPMGKQKQKLLENAQRHIDDAENERRRWEDEQKRKKEAAVAAGGVPAPAPAAR